MCFNRQLHSFENPEKWKAKDNRCSGSNPDYPTINLKNTNMKTLITIAAITILSIGIVIFLKRFKSIISVLLNLFE